ncbi:hypothetical protein WJX77_010649 [Trebouxia sp. C0004]
MAKTLVDLSDCAAVRMASSSAPWGELPELKEKLKGLEEQKAAVLVLSEIGPRELILLGELNKDLDRVQAAITALSSGSSHLLEEATRKATIGAVEIILKKQKLTITSIKDVGVRLMESSDTDSAFFEERLAGYDDAAANLFLQSTMGQQVQQQWAAASKEKDLQACLNTIVPLLLSRCHGESRKYWDTSGSGLRGTELRIDCTVSDGPCCPAHVVTYAEAKFTLISATDQAEAVGQLWQRVEQLSSDQDMRDTWTVATISKNHVQFWYLKRSQHACKCTPLVSFSLSTTSPGFQMWHRWLASTSQALGYLPPELPSPISFGNEQRMHVTAKVCDNSSKLESSSMLHGKVMVFLGKLSDNSPAVAKLPATHALLKQEENNISQISKWPELTGSVVILRGVGQTKSFSRPILILQPVGRLIPYCIEHEALLTLITQFTCIVEQLSIRGYLHGDLSYYNLLQHVDSEGRHHDDQGMRALLVDMQTLMPLREAAQADFTTGTPLFMGLNVIRKQGHCVSTELETLMYVLIFTLSGGILPWRHLDSDDHNLSSVKCGVMTSSSEFFRRVLTYVPKKCWDVLDRLRKLFFTPDYSTDVTCAKFTAELHL